MADFSATEEKITEIQTILRFFDTLSEDLIDTHGKLIKFCERIDEVERLDEAHLLPPALKVFGEHHFTQSGKYIGR